MFQKMRKIERALTDDEAKEILEHGEYGILSTIGSNGYPLGTPVNYVYWNDSIYFHCAKVGHKLDNLSFSSKCGFTIVTNTTLLPEKFSTKYESVIAFGNATECLNQKQQVLEQLILKYAPEHQEAGQKYIQNAIDQTAIYQIKLEQVTGKARK